jgi:hypothetical protein
MDFEPRLPHTGSLVSLDLAQHTRLHAVSNVLAATATRRSTLDTRDDSLLASRLGTTHSAMLASATSRRASEAVSRHSEQLAALLLRPNSRMATLARLPEGELPLLASARGLVVSREGGGGSGGLGRSPHALPSSARRERELQGALGSVLAATASAAAAASPAASAALQAQPPTSGLARAAEAQSRRLERERRAASADTARRKHAALALGAEGGGAEQQPGQGTARAVPQRIARRQYVVSLEGEQQQQQAHQTQSAAYASLFPSSPPGSAIHTSRTSTSRASTDSASPTLRVLPERTTEDQYGLPSPLRLTGRAAQAADAAAAAQQQQQETAEGGRPGSRAAATPLSPFSPHRLLPRLAASAADSAPPLYAHAPEAGVAYPGMHSYGPASHSFRDRVLAKELGPARAVTGRCAAEPVRVFYPGRPGLLDAAATASLQAERAARGLTQEAHPFPSSPKAARLGSALCQEPWQEVGTSLSVPSGGEQGPEEARRRAAALGRPYMLHSPRSAELGVGVTQPWSAWSSPVLKAPDAIALPPPPPQLLDTQGSCGSARSTGRTASHGAGYPAHLDMVRAAAGGVRAGSGQERSVMEGSVQGLSPRCAASASGSAHGFSPAALTVLAGLPAVGGSPRSPRSSVLRAAAAAAREAAAAACAQLAAPSEYVLYRGSGGSAAGEAAAMAAGLTSPGTVAKAVARALAAPTAAGAQAFAHFTAPPSGRLSSSSLSQFARTGVDPLLQGQRAAAPTGLPLALSAAEAAAAAAPSRWAGPWQGTAVGDSFAHSPLRDGLAHYRVASEGQEVDAGTLAATAAAVACAAPGTLSPRCSARVSLSGAGRDAHLSAPSPREQGVAVAGAREAERRGEGSLGSSLGGQAPVRAPLGSLLAGLAHRQADKVLAKALHPGAAGFLPTAKPTAKPSLTSTKGDFLASRASL